MITKRTQLISFLFITLLTGSCIHEPVLVTTCEGGDGGEVVVDPTPLTLDIPFNFPPMFIPDDNPMTEEGVALGKKLFYDVQLSGDNTQACATCHQTEASYADSNQFSKGIDGSIGTRNAMAIVNLGYSFAYFWDGRSATLEEQALEPVKNPIEMNTNWPDVLNKLNADSLYRAEFKIAYGADVIDSLDVAKALAQFERTMISGNSRFDKSEKGEVILTEQERDGQVIFMTERGDCFHCHGTALSMGFVYENNGLQQVLTDNGLGDVTGLSSDIAKFKPPTLRNIELTAPYMHDGRFTTLEEVVEFYDNGVNQSSPNISPLMLKVNRPNGDLNLTAYEKEALVAFLKTLSDSDFLSNPDFME